MLAEQDGPQYRLLKARRNPRGELDQGQQAALFLVFMVSGNVGQAVL